MCVCCPIRDWTEAEIAVSCSDPSDSVRGDVNGKDGGKWRPGENEVEEGVVTNRREM